MSVAAVIAIVLGVAAVGEGVVIGVQIHRADKAAAEYQETLDTKQTEFTNALATCQGDLGTCRAKVTAESMDAAGRIVAAAQESDIADTNLRAAIVEATPLAMYAEAVIETGSPMSISAAAEMAGCRAANTTGDSSRTGCAKEVPERWALANEGLALCPECPHPCVPVPCVPCAETEETDPEPEPE